MRRLTAILAVLLVVGDAIAGGPCSGVRGGCGRSSYRVSDSLPSYSAPPEPPPTTPRHRTSARTSARTTYWKGTASEPDDESLYAPPASHQSASLPARYIVHFANGKRRQAADYRDHGDTFSISSVEGGHTNYPRWMIESVEPLKAEADSSESDTSACYIAHFKSRKTQELLDFYAEGDSWVLFGINGSRGKFPKSMITYFEPTLEALGTVRKWTDSSGSHQTTAQFVSIEDGKVVLLKPDGKKAHVPLDKVSEIDRDLATRFQDLAQSRMSKNKQ